MSTFLAMLLDAYRQLNAKRLFWIILALSGVVVLFYGSIGFGETGMSMFFGLIDIENEMLTRDSFVSRILYRSIFATFILGLWLAWIATILALISTTTIFPDFIADGAIDIVLSKPIGRVKLFFLKYLTSLLFVVLQVSIFCVGIFLCLGLRLDDWEWRIFAAIPLLTVFFSYLYSVNVLVGVWTRSALTALLITMLMWFSIFGVTQSEGVLNLLRTTMEIEVEQSDEQIVNLERQLAELPADEANQSEIARGRLQARVDSIRSDRDRKQEIMGKLDPWHRLAGGVQSVLPKTSETIGLLDRWLRRDTDIDLMDIFTGAVVMNESGQFQRANADTDRQAERRVMEETESKSELYLIGTSLIFEAVVLALACFIFVRRDF